MERQFFTSRVPCDDSGNNINLRRIWFWSTSLFALAIEKSLLNDQMSDVFIVNLVFSVNKQEFVSKLTPMQVSFHSQILKMGTFHQIVIRPSAFPVVQVFCGPESCKYFHLTLISQESNHWPGIMQLPKASLLPGKSRLYNFLLSVSNEVN